MTTYNATWIRRVAWSLDGTRLACGGEDGYIYLWDARGGTQMLQLVGHHGAVTSVAWSPDGTQLSRGSGSQGQGDAEELFLWHAQSGERVCTLARHPGMVVALSWIPSGEWLISGGTDGRLRWWEVPNGECVRVQEGHQCTVHSLKVSSNGRWLAICGEKGSINIWDLEVGEHLRTMRSDWPYERLLSYIESILFFLTSCRSQMCYKTTSGLIKRVCAECRQTQKREERLKHKGKDKALEQQHESDLVKRLEQLGIEVDVSPAVTTLTYEQIYTSGPTLEEALLTFLGEALSRYEALRTWKAHTMRIVTNGTDKHETQDL